MKKSHTILCTSRDYNQVTQLAKIRNLKLIVVGKHGGFKRHSKLNASLHRTKLLSIRIKKFSPDITISFCSPKQQEFLMERGLKKYLRIVAL